MAVLLELSVTAATQELFNKLDDRVGEAMMRAGGPPAGLLAHVVYPVDDGFVVADVWRTEEEGTSVRLRHAAAACRRGGPLGAESAYTTGVVVREAVAAEKRASLRRQSP